MFLNFQKWENTLISKRILILGGGLGVGSLGGLVMLEGILSGGDSYSLNDILINFAFGFEPIIFDNAATIIKWIDSGKILMKYGKTYLEALDGLNLFSISFLPPNEWYAWERNPEYAATGGRYNFSAVAEGYLNGGMVGVFISGVILSFIAVMIRSLMFTKYLFPYNFIFFAPMILIINTLNRKDLMGILGTLEIFFIGSFLFCFLGSFLERIFIKDV